MMAVNFLASHNNNFFVEVGRCYLDARQTVARHSFTAFESTVTRSGQSYGLEETIDALSDDGPVLVVVLRIEQI